jgi:hypothetical protein
MPSRKRLVFISHSGQDTWVAKQIAREVTACGATAFLDQAEIDIGENFETKIRAALQEADELLVLITPWAMERPYVWAELGAVWIRGIPIVGVVYGMSPSELQAKPEVPVFLKAENLVDINDVDEYFAQLKGRLKMTGRKRAKVTGKPRR